MTFLLSGGGTYVSSLWVGGGLYLLWFIKNARSEASALRGWVIKGHAASMLLARIFPMELRATRLQVQLPYWRHHHTEEATDRHPGEQSQKGVLQWSSQGARHANKEATLEVDSQSQLFHPQPFETPPVVWDISDNVKQRRALCPFWIPYRINEHKMVAILCH